MEGRITFNRYLSLILSQVSILWFFLVKNFLRRTSYHLLIKDQNEQYVELNENHFIDN